MKKERSVSIILPIHNGENYLKQLSQNIKKQKYYGDIEVICPVSMSRDNSYSIAKELFDLVYQVDVFNHGLTRHEAACKAKGDILIFITQDILPCNELWLQELVNPLSEEIVATYSQQVPYSNANLVEKLIREFNYPNYRRLANLSTKEKWGRKNIFYSDSSSATVKDIYMEFEGYNFNVLTNEDVLYVSKLIGANKSVLYNPKSRVYHSHNFSIKECWNRYWLIGNFESKNKNILKEYSSNGEGGRLVKYVISELWRKRAIKDLLVFILLDCPTRLLSYKLGYYTGS